MSNDAASVGLPFSAWHTALMDASPLRAILNQPGEEMTIDELRQKWAPIDDPAEMYRAFFRAPKLDTRDAEAMARYHQPAQMHGPMECDRPTWWMRLNRWLREIAEVI